MKKEMNHLDLLREIKNFSVNEEKKNKKIHCRTLSCKIYGFIKGLYYEGVEDWRVRCDFKYMKKQGYNNLIGVLIKNPVFKYKINLEKGEDFYCSRNWDYFMFLFDKL